MQPTKGDINGYKTNHHPKLFFTDKAVNKSGETIPGSKFVYDYDFLFPHSANKSIDFTDGIWDRPLDFIVRRRQLMLGFLKDSYGISLAEKVPSMQSK